MCLVPEGEDEDDEEDDDPDDLLRTTGNLLTTSERLSSGVLQVCHSCGFWFCSRILVN